MKGYLYVADEGGSEIAGSRRYLAKCQSRDQYNVVYRELEALAGEGCIVLDSEQDRGVSEPAH